jgi:hypothetical protein
VTDIARQQAEIDRLSRVAREFVNARQAGEALLWRMAEMAHELHAANAWRALGYDTLEAFCGDPEVKFSRSSFLRLVRLWEEYVVVRKVPHAELQGVPSGDADEVLPAIKRGDISVERGLDMARGLSRSDIRAELAAPNEGLDATREPVRVQCPTCNSVVRADKLHGGRKNEPELSVETTIPSTYVADSERKRQLADSAAERFWKVVVTRGVGGGRDTDKPLHELIHLDRAVAMLTDDEIAEAISSLQKGIAETGAFVAELRRYRGKGG